MEIFSNEIATTLQYFTFPLEVIGLTLATIELKFPSLTNRIGAYFADVEMQSKKRSFWIIDDVPKWSPFYKLSKQSRRRVVITILTLAMVTFVFVTIQMVREGQFLPAAGFTGLLLVSLVLGYGLEKLMAAFYQFINTWVGGRTVGTLGIIIAGFGVLGEAYQFTTQLVV